MRSVVYAAAALLASAVLAGVISGIGIFAIQELSR